MKNPHEKPLKEDNPLSSYIHDHVAGSVYAIDLVEALRDHYQDGPLGQFAADIHAEISLDQATLRDIAGRVGAGSSGPKEAAAWFAEKLSRIKLRHSGADGLGTLEALEFLQLGIHGKSALWRALAEIASREPRLAGFDFDYLMARAESQEANVEKHRLAAAVAAFIASERNSQSTSGR